MSYVHLHLTARTIAFSLVASTVPMTSAQAQCLSDTLTSSTVQENSNFGLAGAIDGDRIIIGTPYDDVGAGQNHGSADMFRRSGSGWTWDGRLTAPAPSGYSLFGRAVDVDGIYAIVGEPHGRVDLLNDVGRAHLFVRQSNGWQYGLTIEPSTYNWPNITESHFGQAVAIDGDYALVGMPDGPVSSTQRPGKAYLYRRTFGNTNWEMQDVFNAPPGSDSLDFGAVLAMQHGASVADTFAVIGNPNHSPTVQLLESGQIRIYYKPTSGTDWGAGFALTPMDPQIQAHFGSAVAISGSTIAVGASGYDGVNADAGAVYIFNRLQSGIWIQSARIDNPLGQQGAGFGVTVSLDGDRLAVGASARMHIFRRIGGDWVHEWTMSGQTTDFGQRSVGISGATAFTGSPNAAVNGNLLAGNASVFELSSSNGSNSCAQATMISTGTYWGCTTAATRDGRSTCDPINGRGDVWYRWAAPCDGSITLDTEFSDFDTLLSVHSDCPTAQNTFQVTCNQDPQSDYSSVTFDVQQGQQYLIRITGATFNDYGNYLLNMEMNCAPPCTADIAPQPSGDGAVDVNDLLLVISTWGVINGAGDINSDASVDVDDLLAVITAWGPCPS